MGVCGVCIRHCNIPDGGIGFCGARTSKNGVVCSLNYGRITSLALDPIEKKPLSRFHPGSMILSAGSFGCNLRCPFCQNNEISWSEGSRRYAEHSEIIDPDELVEIALKTRDRGNIGIAFTYNEPLVGYEYVRDTAKLAKEKGLVTVMVTNGSAGPEVENELLPCIDAMNIDLKGFTDHYYHDVLCGDLQQVKTFIKTAAGQCHIELTTLIVPDENDTDEEMRMISRWVNSLKNPDGDGVPLHISRFFPRFHMTDRAATPVKTIYHLADIARETLKYVYTGNC